MLTFNGNLKVYVALQPCDMRKSFHGLAAVARDTLKAAPLSGGAFLFTNRRRNLIKILYWDGSGLWVVAKRLERGTFSSASALRRKFVCNGMIRAMVSHAICCSAD